MKSVMQRPRPGDFYSGAEAFSFPSGHATMATVIIGVLAVLLGLAWRPWSKALLYATLSLLGLSALLIEVQWLTWAVRVLGGAYLIYLGIKLIRAKPAAIDAQQVRDPVPGSALVFGFLVTLTNPKAIVLFASVFATAVTGSTPTWLLVLMIGLVVACSLVWYSLVSVFMSSPPIMSQFQNARHWIERAAGICFILIAGRILADARTPVTP